MAWDGEQKRVGMTLEIKWNDLNEETLGKSRFLHLDNFKKEDRGSVFVCN